MAETITMEGSIATAEQFPLLHRDRKADTKQIVHNFYLMTAFFSTNHGCMVSCLSLATSRLGSIGSVQSGVLSLSYVASSICGATYVVKRLGGRNAMILGMILYCTYAGCFLVATALPEFATLAAISGAVIGGFGAGFLWTAQGAYMSKAASEYAQESSMELKECANRLAGGFAFLYLTLEVVLRLIPTILAEFLSWKSIFAVNTSIAVLSTIGMLLVKDYGKDAAESPPMSIFYKVTATFQLLFQDPKMKYMIGLNAAFGVTSAFQTSYVNGEVLKAALHDQNSLYVGLFSSWVALCAAIMSLLLPKILSNEATMTSGTLCYLFLVLPFMIQPNPSRWTPTGLIMVYTLLGIGRATFESTLKAIFIEFFPSEPAGAFGNIILQSGLSSSLGYFLTFRISCKSASKYCIEYSDHTLHNLLFYELGICILVVVAIWGYWKALKIHQCEQLAKMAPSASIVYLYN
jgi:MFS family permease